MANFVNMSDHCKKRTNILHKDRLRYVCGVGGGGQNTPSHQGMCAYTVNNFKKQL